jgi:hypothetical protein
LAISQSSSAITSNVEAKPAAVKRCGGAEDPLCDLDRATYDARQSGIAEKPLSI